jgi:hypothetical protein
MPKGAPPGVEAEVADTIPVTTSTLFNCYESSQIGQLLFPDFIW